jgi:SET and MYND domain-containing protein
MSVTPVTAVLRPLHQGRRCNCCMKKAETKLLRCSGCHRAFYCSAACQKLEWPSHKRECGCLSTAAEQGLEGDSLGDAVLLGRLLHNEQRRRSNQPTNFYSSAAEGSGTVLGQDVDDVIAMQWHEEDVDESVELAQLAAGAGLLPLEPPSATVSPVSSPQQSSSKKKSSKKKARGKKSSAAAVPKPVPLGGLRAAATRLAQFRCNNFGITDELLLPIGAGIFPAAALLNHSCAPNAALSYELARESKPRMKIRLIKPVERGEEICHNFVVRAQNKKLQISKAAARDFTMTGCCRATA